jgi:transposase-like protein
MEAQTLQEAIKYFSNEQVCIDAVAQMRWPDGVRCPACNAEEPYWIKTQKRWKCRECRRQFSVKLGTIFEDSPIPLQKWLPAMWLLVNCKNGISSYEISRDLKVSQKAAWFMLHRLRLVLQNVSATKLGGNHGPVEADETFIGGLAKNMHATDRARKIPGSGGSGKTVVMGFLDRNAREVRAKVVPNVKRETLQAEVLANVDKRARVYTDNFLGYNGLDARVYVHEVVDHIQTYVRGQVHTNGIEKFWSLLKRQLNGTYVAVEPFHLGRYVDEQVFRFNNRKHEDGTKMTDAERFTKALSLVAGKRLTFAEVTGNTGSEATF